VLWNPSPSTDVVGYHVYRQDGTEWHRLTTEPIAKTSYVDTQAPKKGARYRVTAVDRSMKKNESVPSEEVQNR
jgi:fibronectin type 3 domain-containing protein